MSSSRTSLKLSNIYWTSAPFYTLNMCGVYPINSVKGPKPFDKIICGNFRFFPANHDWVELVVLELVKKTFEPMDFFYFSLPQL